MLALITEKSVVVSYIQTTGCSRRKRSANGQSEQVGHKQRSRRQAAPEDLYSFIAAYSGGQVLHVDTESISELASIIFLSSDRSFTQILHLSGTTAFSVTRPFFVDNTVSRISINLNGNSIAFEIIAPGGTDLLSLDPSAVSVDLDTSTSFIATINISDSSLYGTWEIRNFSSVSTYSIQVNGISSLRLSYQLYQLDPESNLGFRTLEGIPLQGETLLLLITTSGEYEEVEFTSMDLLTNDGSVQQQFNLTKVGDGSYGTIFTPPSTSDMLQVGITGVHSSVYTVRRVSGTSVQLSDIYLSFDEGSSKFNTLYPGNSSNVTLVVSNFGDPASFQISISDNNINSTFSYLYGPQLFYLSENETINIKIEVTASASAVDGNIINFIVTAATSGVNIEARSNYITFVFVASTLPPPEFTENIIGAAVKESLSVLLLVILLLANICLQLF